MAEAYLAPVDPTEDAPDEPKGLSIPELLGAIRRRWWLVAACTAIVLAVGYWHTMREPRLYSATATVRLQSNQMLLPGMQPGAQRLDYRIDPLLSEQALIKSQQVSERVAEAEGLQLGPAETDAVPRSALFGNGHPIVDADAPEGDYILRLQSNGVTLVRNGAAVATAAYGDTLRAPGIRMVVPSRPDVKGNEVKLHLASLTTAAEQVRGNISSRVIPSTDLIEISYMGRDPVSVRNVANAVAIAYQQFSSEGQRATAGQKTKFIEQSLGDQAKALQVAQDSLKSFKEQNQTADIPTEAKALFTSITAFETEQRELETERQVYESLMGKVAATDTVDDELRRLAGTGVLSKNVAVAAKFEQWQALLKQRQDLLLQGTVLPNNPDLVRIDNAITQAKADIRAATEIYLDGIKSRLATLASTIADMKTQSERYPPLEAQQARLESNVETAQHMYVDLKSQYQLSRISESADGGTVRIIDEALLPDHAVSPNRKRGFLLSLALGLMLGIGLAVFLERIDDSVRSPLELSDNFSLPVLGLIPAINAAEALSVAASTGLNRIVTHADPRSPVAEAYRSLRTNLAFARVQRGLRSLLLTSPGPADGKSTTVANLAITFAQQGQRTLLIDADLRRAVLDKTFSVSRAPGLTDVIIGESKLGDAVHETQVPNLFVLTSGQLPPNPSELLGSAAMRQVLAEAEEMFDVVLFDSPPLLAVTDAAVLSTMVDGTVVIARMGNTQRKALWRAVSQLRAVNANVLGGVLNDVRAETSPYYGGQGYYYYYYTPQDENAKSPPLRVLDKLKRLTAAR